ncbi:TetR/AcrR family transcriptional regulator [Mycolicibacterium hodleri]|uniref:TetR/AcrR family transcriptional regulator n=1 Tax=Mycolicibacterium hodleri TaxID=49897 RepID=A0A502E266_9MYCO|nr:TetR/AcrR family transcriptional regulator [Mycolicibacterium hodleri]TPG31673.1 TetR/AcrR family transcriptional regulator [Mycolicibacterium hodleri]
MTDTTGDTRTVIVETALSCFRTHGLRRTSVVDIAHAAGVSRSTVYEYFADKRAIVDAASEHATQSFYRRMARAMATAGTLEDQLAGAAVAVVQARHFIVPERLSDPSEVHSLLTTNAAALLRECGQFLAPYLSAAKLTGEVRRDLDVDGAAEWFARMLFSLFLTPSERLDLDDADAVAGFVREHVVRGFVDARSRQPPNRQRQVP